MISTAEFAARLGVSVRAITDACNADKLPGAMLMPSNGRHSYWMIPEHLLAECSKHTTSGGRNFVRWPVQVVLAEMIPAVDFAKRVGIHRTSIGYACADGRLPGAVRQKWHGRDRWMVPEGLVELCTVSGKGNRKRIKYPGKAQDKIKREYKDDLPRCPICGLVLIRDGTVYHLASGADAKMCWRCEEEGAELPIIEGVE